MPSSGQITAADKVEDGAGRQYHLNVAPGDVASYVLLAGDPARAKKTAQLFDSIEFETKNREFVTFTGAIDGEQYSVISTGIGTDNTEIVIIELCNVVENPTIIRIGSCGSLQEEAGLGTLVISSGAVRLENTSLFFVTEGYPAIAAPEVVLALVETAETMKSQYTVGLTASASGFYGAQGREIPGFPVRFPDLPDQLAKMNVVNFEMESSALFSLAAVRGFLAGTVCAVYANRPHNTFISPEVKKTAEKMCIKTGLGALKLLRKWETIRKEKKAKRFYPGLLI
ncbi:MAG: nucleoside phosphorylase [Candidatus Heimdallarchaeota archaeon]